MSFKKDLISGTAYTAIAKYLSLFVSIGVSAILSRILPPQAFGTIAIATIFLGFITLFTTSGLSPAIIQNQTLSNEDMECVFSFTVYSSVGFAALFGVASPFITLFYGDEQLLHICQWLTIYVIFSVVNIVPNALLFKYKRFKYIAVRTIVVQLTLGIISLIGAFMGMGVYALLINPIGSSILLFALSYRCYPIRFRVRFAFEPVKMLLPYSFYQIGFNIFNYMYRNIDKLLLGRYMGLTQLGFYEKSYRLMMMPLDNISNVLNPVLHPLLCEHQESPQFIFNKYKIVTRYLGYIGFLISAICFFCAREIILIVFGQQWEASVAVFRIFSLSIGIQLVQSAVGAVFQSTGNVKQLFFSGCFAFLSMIIAIIIGIMSNNVETLAAYVVGAFFIIFFIYHYYLICRVIHAKLWSFVSTLARPITAAVILSCLLWGYDYIGANVSLMASLCAKLSISIISIIMMQELGLIRDIPSILQILKNIFKHVRCN